MTDGRDETRVSPPNCAETMRALWDYLDRALDTATLAEIDAHLETCTKCREHERFERTLLEQIRALRSEHADVPTLRVRVTEALTQAGWTR